MALYYKNNYPWQRDYFTDCLNECFTLRIDINMACVGLIDGGQGQGKTTLGTHMVDFFNKKRGFPPMDLSIKNNIQIGLGGADFISKFNKCNKAGLPAMIYDEAGDYQKASTISGFNYQISKIFQKIRSARIIVLMALPNFNILDNRLFDDEIVRFALHCHSRQLHPNFGTFSAYDMDNLSWVRHNYTELPVARRRRCYDFVSPLWESHFKNLPKERADRLEILSTYGKEKERAQAEVELKGLVSKLDLQTQIGKSLSWVESKLYKYNVPPVEKLGTKNFYPKSVIRLLEKDLLTKQK